MSYFSLKYLYNWFETVPLKSGIETYCKRVTGSFRIIPVKVFFLMLQEK